MTTKLYDSDAYLQQFDAQVISCTQCRDQTLAIVLNATAFFPEAGGQSADTGTLGNLPVTDVQIDDRGVITHFCKIPADPESDASLPTIEAGQTVHGRIDWARRFSMMQHHTGEHMFSGLVFRDHGFANVGFHLSDHICTMDYNGVLSPEDIHRLEAECNRHIFQNRHITCSYPGEDALDCLTYRCKGELTPPIRIVTIDGVDCCACCAPHVRRTGEVGILKVVESKSYKGGVRLTIVCGQKAFADYCRRFEIVNAASRLLSSHYETLEDRVSQLVAERNALQLALADARRERLTILLEHTPAASIERPAVLFIENVDTQSLRHGVNAMMEQGEGICAIFCGNDTDGYTFIAGSRSIDMQTLAAFLRQTCSAKCGGSAQMIQGQLSRTSRAIADALQAFSGE